MAARINFKRRRRDGRAGELGYSLLEVLIVLAIIALVAALVGPRLIAQLDRSKVTAARVQITALMSSMETMRIDLGRYPTESEGLDLLVRAPNGESDGVWAGPYLDAGVPEDPWGRPYVYEPPANLNARPRIASLGADGEPGGEDIAADISVGDPP
ncbi:general secretion pathway protein G [alpha proteobacterium U9-1i]|nr:general secretion pathway protein G [alpha proteobacterium U9-1i]